MGKFSIEEIEIEGIEIEVHRKKVKNLNLAVLAPLGKVRVSVPLRVRNDEIFHFVRTKIEWIKKHQDKIIERAKKPELTALQHVSGEKVFVWGKSYGLEVAYNSNVNCLEIEGDVLNMMVKEGSTSEYREKVLLEWHRENLKKKIPELMEKWQKKVGVQANDWGVKNMKTRWGTCNIRAKRIWLNLQLAKKHPRCLEYVVVHELVHLLEKKHDKVFYGYMDQFLPGWKSIRNELNDKGE